jgi:hypothetical protein
MKTTVVKLTGTVTYINQQGVRITAAPGVYRIHELRDGSAELDNGQGFTFVLTARERVQYERDGKVKPSP